MVYWLASYPRSGSTRLRLYLYHYWKIPSASSYQFPESHHRMDAGALCGKLANRAPDESDALSPEKLLYKTHELTRDNHPAIYIVRNGLDALFSSAHYILSPDNYLGTPYAGRSIDEVFQILCGDDLHFGGWSNHLNHWLLRKTLTIPVRYEDLVHPETRLKTIDSAFRKLGWNLSNPSHLPFPHDNTLLDQVDLIVNKPSNTREKNSLSKKSIGMFKRRHGEMMCKLGYPIP